MLRKDKYINPFTDFGFKKLFGTELNKDLLIDFLNEVILPKQRKITDLTYSNNDHLGNNELDRKAIFDIYCLGAGGERFIVEMQKAKQNYFKDRSVFYSTFPIQEQAMRGDWDFKLAEVYTVGILDFVFSEDQIEEVNAKKGKKNNVVEVEESTSLKEVRHEVKLKDQNFKVFYDKLTFIYLEMPNFTKTEEQLETDMDKWLYILQKLPTLHNRPNTLGGKIFDKLFEAAEIAKYSAEEQQQYEDSLKSYRDLKNVIDKAFKDGESQGRIEGKIETAKMMKADNEPIEKIMRYTGLTKEQIDDL